MSPRMLTASLEEFRNEHGVSQHSGVAWLLCRGAVKCMESRLKRRQKE